ncbi:DUF1349 domain-containing protein [Dysgonomonas sp. HDW5A]|uniref:DUF1349 domain-containing protein n=1 Tax=Dysgonomonas sp. HDW5A TaxID=2714926 RepID=UPI00140E63DA|nr:DUF1349 domain-containing protein [Dysgonomonas sp. HDW5A]QIK59269.1 DUF1349 domain-containing protein [Dysgonomonas sp. HDW5A]
MKKILILCVFVGFCIQYSFSQSNHQKVELSSIPKNISWVNTPLNWNVSGNTLSINAGRDSRLFIDPQRLSQANSAPMALFKPDETFLFSCKVSGNFRSVFDAAVLMVYGNNNQWAKLCLEYSPQYKPMVVSVVTNQFSDDSNHETISREEVYLRIAGLGNGAYAFHYSLDGRYWNMVRYFYLNPNNDLKIGFLSQSPKGESFNGVFTDIQYTARKLNNIRNGE